MYTHTQNTKNTHTHSVRAESRREERRERVRGVERKERRTEKLREKEKGKRYDSPCVVVCSDPAHHREASSAIQQDVSEEKEFHIWSLWRVR